MTDNMSVYRERAHLVAFLTTLYPSVGSYNDPDEPEYLVVYVESPVGQMSWHIHPDDLDLFDGLTVVPDHQWDGHDTENKYKRLREFTKLRRMPSSGSVTAATGGARKRLDDLLSNYTKRVAVNVTLHDGP